MYVVLRRLPAGALQELAASAEAGTSTKYCIPALMLFQLKINRLIPMKSPK